MEFVYTHFSNILCQVTIVLAPTTVQFRNASACISKEAGFVFFVLSSLVDCPFSLHSQVYASVDKNSPCHGP